MNLADALRRVNTEGTASPEPVATPKPVADPSQQAQAAQAQASAGSETQPQSEVEQPMTDNQADTTAASHLDAVDAAAHEAQLSAQATASAAMATDGHVPSFGDGVPPEGVHQHVQSGNVVRLELFLSAEQMSGLFKAIMAGQHTVLTLREAAAFLRVSQDTLLKLAEEGEIPGVHLEGRWRFPKANLEDWLTMQSMSHEEGEDVA